MLRIHFTAEDLRRTRVATGPDPLWESLLSLHMLARRDGTVVYGDWRRQARSRLPASTRLLRELAPPWGYSPDFLTPAAGTDGLAAGIETVLRTPRQLLRRDVALLAADRRPARAVVRLAEGDPDALRGLGDALSEYHEAVLAPHWNHVRSCIEADRVVRGRALLDGGPDGLFTGLHPSMRWEPPVLSIRYGFGDRDLHLDGRGMLLLPSFFCTREPITLRDPDLPPVLVYPVEHDLGWATGGVHGTSRYLAALLGRTRSAVLESMTTTLSTGEIARRLDISPASASEHATVLREAGLITTRRHRNSVYHCLTPLGADLLNGRGRPHSAPVPREAGVNRWRSPRRARTVRPGCPTGTG
ncbi:MAG: winged helix-turn-helix domain-containing protein [Actinocatenispora sp.]